MKKYINIIIILIISLHIYTLPKLEYEYPKNPVIADSLIEEYFGKISDIINRSIEGEKSKKLRNEWEKTTKIIEDAIDYASKPLSEEQISILFDIIEKMRLHKSRYISSITISIFTPHMKRWGYDSRMEAIIIEGIDTPNAMGIAFLIGIMNKACLENQELRQRCMDIVSFKDITTNKKRETVNKRSDLAYSDNALFAAMDYLSNVYPDDREVMEAMADGILPADTLGYTVRWHLRYFKDNPYIIEHLKVNRDIAYEILWQKYETADNDRKKLLYLYSAISTHKMKVTKEIYEEALVGLLTTDISVLRDFLFSELFNTRNSNTLSIDINLYEYGYSKLKEKKELLLEKYNYDENKFPQAGTIEYAIFEIEHPVLFDFMYYTHMAGLAYKRMLNGEIQ